ncbi:MAG: EAL domain-containing protein [Gammaproteobacteria bacterium]|nr:EAL domain-containing protein [Gammaproteobacteria bacterium]MDH5310610.1 EAL domain-containing protein [Gammaproteobacteria bacterium]
MLIADDDPATRVIMREVLEQAGFGVVEAVDGKEALRCYEQLAPDVILLDVEMPYLDGFSVCQRIRDQETSRKTPICIVTGLDDDRSVDRAYHVGATDFISKPIAWPVLGHRLRYILRANEALNEIKGLVLALPDIVFILDDQGRTRECVTEIDSRGRGDDGATNNVLFEDLISEEDRGRVQECIRCALLSGEPQIHEHEFARDSVHFETRFVARDRHSVIAIMRDVTERKKADLQIYDLAFYDQLTGLPNRQLFSKELDAVIESTRDEQGGCAILFVDLDRFKRINDTLGHSMGDELLKDVAARLRGCLRSDDRVLRAEQEWYANVRIARLGGDEFVIVLHDIGSENAAASVASRIVTSFAQPFSCEGHQFVVTPSIGIAIYPQDGSTNDELLMNADAAMYKAKAAGRNNYKFYSDTMKVRSLHRLEMETELRRAIENEQFTIHYQPKVDLASWTVVGAEALLRWKHDQRGWIPPAEFIPIAEETGLILPLGKWVLQEACRQIGEWRNSRLNRLSVSVNISSQQMHSDDLIAAVDSAVADAGIEAELLDLEITESLLMRDTDATVEALKTLRNLGVTLSIDDFGTGYSSLSYLKRFPINVLKIDRSFVKDLHRDADDAAICAAILAMARNLDLKVVAEGVELEEQLSFLRHHNCNIIQGYLFSRALSAGDFERLVVRYLGPSMESSRLKVGY